MNAWKDDPNGSQIGQSAPVSDVPSQTTQKDTSELSATEPLSRSEATKVAANEPSPQPNNSTTNPVPSSFKLYDEGKDFSCWLRRLKFHLDDVPQNERSRTVLCDRLQRLFQPPLTIEEALDQLLKRSLRSDETPRQFVDALLRLSRDAFPSLSAADRDQVVLYHFERGLGSQEVTYSLRIQPPGDLNEAIQRASRMLTTDVPTGDNHFRPEL
nr:unnamed protein product [Spirometra erinaceieuropaei]